MVWAALQIPGMDFDPRKALPVSVQILQPSPALTWLCSWNCCSKAEQMENFLLFLVETSLWVSCRAGNLGPRAEFALHSSLAADNGVTERG